MKTASMFRSIITLRAVGTFANLLPRDAARSDQPVLTRRFTVSALAMLAGTLSLLLANHAPAASQTWDNGSTDFIWNTSSLNWGGVAWTNGNDAVFGATGVGTITVSGTQTVGTGSDTPLTFNTAGYTLSGGTLALPGLNYTNTLAVNANATITSVLSDSGTTNMVIKSGTGTLTLDPGASNTNTVGTLKAAAGGLTLNSGGLNVTANGNPQATGLWIAGGTVTVAGGTLNANTGTYATIHGGGTLAVSSGTANIAGAELLLGYGSSAGTVTVSGTGTLNVPALRVSQTTGLGTVNLNGGTLQMNNFTDTGSGGVVNFNGGTVQAKVTTAAFTVVTNNMTYNVSTNGAIFDTVAFNITIGSPLVHYSALGATLDGGLTKNGTGTLTLTNANTYTGKTTVGAGTVSVSAINNYGLAGGLGQNTSATVTQLGSGANAGTLAYIGSGETNNRTFLIGDSTAANAGGAVINNNGTGALIFNAGTFNPTITGITATRTLTLGGTNSSTTSEIQGNIQNNNGSTGKLGLIVNGSSWKLSGNNTNSGQAGTTGLGIETKAGTLTISGGTTTVNTYGLGTYSPDAGTFNQTGGTVSVAGDLIVGWNSSPTFTLSGGSLTAANIRRQDLGNSILTISGTATVTAGNVYETSGSAGTSSFTVNLNTGGTLVANHLYENVTAGTTNHSLNVNFNGGTLKAGATTNLIDVANSANGSINVTNGVGGAVIDSSTFTVTNLQPIWHDATLGATADGGLTKLGTGTLVLSATNTYSGATTISNGVLALGANGYITNSAAVVVASNAVFDVSARVSAFALASTLPSQVLSNSAPGAIIKGTNNCSAGTLSLVYDGVNPCFTQTNGGMTLSAATVIKINNTGAQLTPGSYTLITNTTAGYVAGAVTTSPVTISGHGASGTATLSVSGSRLVLNVAGGGSPGSFSGISVSGTGLTLTVTNGPANGPWTLLESTNLLLPVSQWWTNRTGTYDGGGNLTTNIANLATNPAAFYLLK